MAVSIQPSSELVELFTTYTGSPTAIGARYAQAAAFETNGDPLIVATSADLVLFPGSGAPPEIEGFRLSTRGFKEMAAVSHLGPAVATLARMRAIGADWRPGAEELLAATRAARAANGEALWREQIAVAAFAGREAAIAAMVDYACDVTERVLERALAEPGSLTAANLRRDYFEGAQPVPFNRVMVATFFLTGMDIAHRIIAWFDGHALPWERTMVIIAGQQGRATAGVTADSNSVSGVIAAASRGRLPAERLLIAPHAPVFGVGASADEVAALEPAYRALWSSVSATCELGEDMFAGYPRFAPAAHALPSIDAATASVGTLPAVERPDDWLALTTRLRVVLEDPRQLLSGAVTDYASRQLVQHANRPSAVTVPGLDGEPYPRSEER